MILTEEVEIILNSRTVDYYESRGYFIPRYFNKRRNKFCFKNGTKIKILIKDLYKKSNVKVLRKCDVCNKIEEIKYYQYTDICKTCSMRLVGYNNFKHGKPKCENCGIQLKNFHATLCLKCLGKKQTGENNPNWNKCLTDEERIDKRDYKEYDEWRFSIYRKDKYKCIKCNSKTVLNAHHIKNYSKYKELRLDIKNGVTLCEECHKNFHKIYGKVNNNETQLQEFLKGENSNGVI